MARPANIDQQSRSISLKQIRVIIFCIMSVSLLAVTFIPPYLVQSRQQDILQESMRRMIAHIVDVSAHVSEESQAQLIRQKATDVAQQVAVLFSHSHNAPNTKKLRSLAVQPIGDAGYTAMFECKTGITVFHKNPALENADLHYLKDTFPGWWKIYDRSQDCAEASGQYDWKDADGTIRKKFMAVAPIAGTGYMLAATTYLDEFAKDSMLIEQTGNATLQEAQRTLTSSVGTVIRQTLLIVLGIVLFLFLLMLTMTKNFARFVYNIQSFSGAIGGGDYDVPSPRRSHILEFDGIASSLDSMRKAIVRYQHELVEKTKQLTIVGLTQQVVHDIRSPLAALAAVEPSLTQLPEEQRVLVRRATARIQDIANHLIAQSRASHANALVESFPSPQSSPSATQPADTQGREGGSIELLSSLIDPLVTEKRLQFRARGNVEIQAALDEAAYGLFAQVQPTEFKRVLSNLVNNAVEGIAHGGSVRIYLRPCDDMVCVEVEDTGKGIPPDVLPKLTERGATFGKAGGSGLGLFHARERMEAWGGTLTIASTVGTGTTVTLRLPAADPPAWFVPVLSLRDGQTIVVLDDDPSIHDLWRGRLEALRSQMPNLAILHFSTAEETLAWHAEVYLPQAPSLQRRGEADVLYLVDYELLGQPSNGLALIEHLQIAQHAILVTSRYEDPAIREKCAALGVRLIPKGLAGFVPIRITGDRRPATGDGSSGYRVLLIDDDPDIGLVWKVSQKVLQIGELTYVRNLEELQAQQIDVAAFDVVFVDKNIEGSAHDGVATIAYLREHGAQRIVLASGERADDLRADPQFATVDGVCSDKIPASLAPYLAVQ